MGSVTRLMNLRTNEVDVNVPTSHGSWVVVAYFSRYILWNGGQCGHEPWFVSCVRRLLNLRTNKMERTVLT